MNQISSSNPDKRPKTKRGQKTQEKLLTAAEAEFGERGFHEAAISSITQRAGVALGTFYVYFDSKEEIFRALVSHMGRLTRSSLSQSVADIEDRITAERMGLEAYIEFTRKHKNLYRIVMEAQFVAPDAYREYYDIFADGYRSNLSKAYEKGQISKGDDDMRAWALIGMNSFLGLRYAVWDETIPAKTIADAVGDFVAHGLSPKD